MFSPDDTAEVVSRVGHRWEQLRSARLFLTGGTGFVGTWLLAGLCEANRRLGLDARVVVLSRDPAAFARSAPELADDEASRRYAATCAISSGRQSDSPT